jgi:hypothetical protein
MLGDMNVKGLDDFSISVANRLFTQFPEWQKFVQIKEADNGTNYLQLEIEPPHSASVAYGLTITTENKEVVVSFDYYQGLFFDQFFDGECLGADIAVDFIYQLVSEEISVVSWWNDDQLIAWSTIVDGKAQLPADIVGAYSHVRIRSWNGTMNDDRDLL